MSKRLAWKTITFGSMDEVYRLQASYTSSRSAFGQGKTMHFDGNIVETNIPVPGPRLLCRVADVHVDWRNGVLWDTEARQVNH